MRRTQNTNDDQDFADEMDYEQDDDAPVEDAMESGHYNSPAV